MNNKQNRKFKKQVSHLSGFVGMPMWNGSKPTLSEIREFDRRVIEQQALAFELDKSSSSKRLSTWVSSIYRKTKKQFCHAFEKKARVLNAETKKTCFTHY